MKHKIFLMLSAIFLILSINMVFADDIPDLAGTNNMTIIAGDKTNASYQNFSEGIYFSQENITFDRTSSIDGWSISAWYKIEPTTNFFIFADIDSASQEYIQLGQSADDIQFEDTEASHLVFNNFSVLLDDNYHNFILIKDGFNYSLYVDNILINSSEFSSATNNLTGLFLLGIDNSNNNLEDASGLMKQLAIYDKALISSEISQIYADGEDGQTTTDGLIHYWSFTTLNQEQQQQISSSYLSSPIYQVMASSGAGLGIFIQILGQALPLLLIGLAFVGILVVIVLSIKKVLIKSGSP